MKDIFITIAITFPFGIIAGIAFHWWMVKGSVNKTEIKGKGKIKGDNNRMGFLRLKRKKQKPNRP